MNTLPAKYLLMTAIALVAMGCRKAHYEPDPADVPSGKALVTVVYDPGALGDRSYNDLIYAGVERTALANGLRTMQFSPSTSAEGLAILQTYFEQMSMLRDTVRRLLIVAGSEYDDYLRRHSDELGACPRADLLYLETKDPLPGKGSTICLPYYSAMYEAGAVATAFSDNLLLIAANPLASAIRESVEGFTEGFNAKYVLTGDDHELQVEWISDEEGGGFRIDDEDAMRIVYDSETLQIAQLVFPVCGGASGTFYRMSGLFGGFDYIGIDVVSISNHCPFSVVKHIDRAVDLCIGQWLSSEGMPKHQTLSFADGWTEVVLHPYTDLQKAIIERYLPEDLLQTIHADAMKKEAGNE